MSKKLTKKEYSKLISKILINVNFDYLIDIALENFEDTMYIGISPDIPTFYNLEIKPEDDFPKNALIFDISEYFESNMLDIIKEEILRELFEYTSNYILSL